MNRDSVEGLACGAGIVALAVCLSIARKLGYVEFENLQRVIFGSIGVMVAVFGNRIPKAFVASVHAQRAKRVAGWSMVLSGIIYASLWTFASIAVAAWVGLITILVGIAVTMGYCFSLPSKAKIT